MNKHTPGPWEILNANNYNGYAIAPRGTLPTLASVERPKGNNNLTIINCFNFPGNTKANAILIAAAPKLFEALEKIADLDPAEDSDEGFNEWGEADCFNMAQKIAKEILAKIKGD